MKNFSKIMLISLVLLAIAVVSAATLLDKSRNTVNVQKNVSYKPDKNYNSRVKQGLDEIKFSSSASENKIAASVRSLSKFMEDRSGVVLSPEAQKILVSQEQSFRLNNSNGVSLPELSELIFDTITTRASNWNEQETAAAVESWKGFYDPDLPESYKKGRSRIKLRANGAGIRIEDLLTSLSALKEGNGEPSGFYVSYLRQEIAQRTENKYSFLSEIAPEYFSPPEQNVSPFNAMLIAYSMISDDYLMDSINNLNQNMVAISDWSKKKYKKYPSPNGYKAYGPNGFMYSSPTNLLLDNRGISFFLEGLQNKEDK